MKRYTEEQIERKVKELWYDDKAYRRGLPENIAVLVYDDYVTITLSSMYEPPGLKFSQLKSLSEFFETDNINDDERFSEAGCDTCDYGSSYGFTLTIRPSNVCG